MIALATISTCIGTRIRAPEVANANGGAGQNAVQTVKYVYDGFDRRIVKIVDADGVGVQAATTESFVYGQGVGAGGGQGSDELLLARTGTTGAVTHRYLHGVLADQVRALYRPPRHFNRVSPRDILRLTAPGFPVGFRVSLMAVGPLQYAVCRPSANS